MEFVSAFFIGCYVENIGIMWQGRTSNIRTSDHIKTASPTCQCSFVAYRRCPPRYEISSRVIIHTSLHLYCRHISRSYHIPSNTTLFLLLLSLDQLLAIFIKIFSLFIKLCCFYHTSFPFSFLYNHFLSSLLANSLQNWTMIDNL